MIKLAVGFILCGSVHSDEKAPTLEEPKCITDGEPESVSTIPVVEARKEVNAATIPVIDCSSSAKCSVWEPESSDAPGG